MVILNQITIYVGKMKINKVIGFINKHLEKYNCNVFAILSLDIAMDEILSNILSYAYKTACGTVTIKYDLFENNVIMKFIDSGIQYNPVCSEDPDVGLSIEYRKEGGLGIYLVKKQIDSIEYKYINNKNILTIKKHI